MPNVIHNLVNDHMRVRKMLQRFGRYTGDLNLALQICDELTMHAKIEEELVYPLVRDKLDARLADESEEDHEEMKHIIAQIQDLEPGDEKLQLLIHRLKAELERHAQREEREIFPELDRFHDDMFEAGRQAYARTQSLLQERSGPPPKPLQVANSGWGNPDGGRRDVANPGW